MKRSTSSHEIKSNKKHILDINVTDQVSKLDEDIDDIDKDINVFISKERNVYEEDGCKKVHQKDISSDIKKSDNKQSSFSDDEESICTDCGKIPCEWITHVYLLKN